MQIQPETTPTISVTTFQIASQQSREIVISKPGDYVVELIGVGASAHIKGAFLATDKMQIDVNLFIVHKAAHTTAQTTLKGVAKDKSRIRFFGRIKIEPNCPGTQSFLEERILLLSDKASAEAVPELEILSDDVKCSHAASISPIPEEQLFYLESRGIARAAAEELVSDGFLAI